MKLQKKNNTTVALLCGLNKINDANKIYAGQKIQVHPNYKASGGEINNSKDSSDNFYEVKRGDTLSDVSIKTGVSLNHLKILTRSLAKVIIENLSGLPVQRLS